jgi:hypothetical protein
MKTEFEAGVSDDTQMSALNMSEGAVIERLDDEISAALLNCMDPNAKAGTRKVVLTLSFTPSEDRQLVEIGIECASKLQPAYKVTTRAYVGKGAFGKPEAFEIKPRQAGIPFATNQLKEIKGGVK